MTRNDFDAPVPMSSGRVQDYLSWNTPATVHNCFSDTALMVRYPDGQVIPVAVPAGTTAQRYADILAEVMGDEYEVQDVRRN